MKLMRHLILNGLLLALALGSSGCLNLKPSEDLTRHFFLSAEEDAPALSDLPEEEIGLGVGPIGVPSIYKNSMAIQVNPNELRYMESYLWSDPLERGLQRVMTVNLSHLLATDQIAVGSWQRETVDVELQMNFNHIDVDLEGNVKLEMFWQLFLPGGDKPIHSEKSTYQQSGASPLDQPELTASMFSKGLYSLSQTIANKVKELALEARAGKVQGN